ncbi:glycosyltransferase family 92 protein F13G3.3-like isoform X2 [Hyla sarda]|nr:glycosyltransferase family 92 protein F13G3.3-like isoform X2 [Hyla sarda]XP_056395105.1 glycosyltransferase family 92 protein F13G3.3-like isoform X2 [Hyla sarda]
MDNMKGYLTVLMLSVIFMISTYYHRIPGKEAGPRYWNISTDTITPLENNKIFVISAYYDGRESRRVRVLTVIKGEDVTELYCRFYCLNGSKSVPVKATIEVHSKWFDFHYGPADVICPMPYCHSHHISIHWSDIENTSHIPMFEIKNLQPQPFSATFTVCISTMFGKQENVLQFIQTMEMYRLLGAQKVVIYKNGCSKAIGQVLDYYVSEGIVEIVPWPIDKYLRTSDAWYPSMNPENQIGYYGQIAALSDCLYRNMYKSRYVTFNDMDEIILPRLHKTWDAMMDTLEKDYPDTAVYLIENHYYPNTITVPDFETAFPKSVPGINILQVIHYEPERPNTYNNHKMIVNPRKVIQISVHSASKTYRPSVDVPNHIVGLHHCRTPVTPNLPQTSLIKDTTIWKYNSSLITNVNTVLRQLNYH